MAIDHDQRRRLIADIAIGLIAREGLGATTIRRIAAEAGFSTAAITHYFADKHAMLVWVLDQLATIGEEEFATALDPQETDIVAPLLTMVAWCPRNVMRWRAYLAFWDQAARDPQLADLIVASTRSGLSLIEGLIARYRPGSVDAAQAARLLNAMVQGLSMQVIVAPDQWPPDLIRQTVQEAVAIALDQARISD